MVQNAVRGSAGIGFEFDRNSTLISQSVEWKYVSRPRIMPNYVHSSKTGELESSI